MKVEIPLKLVSLNEYIRACRSNKFAGAKMKADMQEQISWYITKMPKYNKPIFIHFHWVEGNKRRDIDNAAFGKKFILDAMVKMGKIPDDNPNYIKGFSDTFEYGKEFKIILDIQEVQDENTN